MVTKITLTSKGETIRRLLTWIAMETKYSTPTALKSYAKYTPIKQKDIDAWIKDLEQIGLIRVEKVK